MNYDYALVELSKAVDFTKISWVRPACLPEATEPNIHGLRGMVSGWGLTDWTTKTQTTVLQSVTVSLMKNSACLNYYSNRQLTESMLCGASTGADACNGDSGGPLTVQDGFGRSVLTGVVSWGIQCGRREYPGVYARVSFVLDWIKETSGDGQFCGSKRSRAVEMAF